METNEKISFTIANILVQIGIPYNINGSKYLKRAVELAIQNPTAVMSITKNVYKPIAKENATKSANVERAIRHAIEVAWSRGKIENINQIFGIKVYSPNEKPTNGEFIALIADKMLLEGA